MICTTVREGDDCVFMTAKGCGYNGGACLPIIDQCNGCNRITSKFETGVYCAAAPDPSIKWENGNCNIATHVKTVSTKKKQKINPIKASKRR
ncbi:MAG: PxxKW family cysteine-rich protein [Desulfobacula sp.]|nr:PxxKW family cysteine-rich protein [Desulfobacula sp.]